MTPLTDEIISVKSCKSLEDYNFIEACMNSEEFGKFIGERLNHVNQNYYLLKKDEKYVGCFSLNIDNSLGVSICAPNIYISNRAYSLHGLFKVVSYIMNECDVDKISIRVYGFNKKFISLLKKLSIHCEGVLKYSHVHGNVLTDMHLFSILKSELKSHSIKLNERYNKKC